MCLFVVPFVNCWSGKVNLTLCFAVILALLPSFSCRIARGIGQPDLDSLYNRVLDEVTIGTSLEDATLQMKGLGFHCEFIQDGTIMFTDQANPNVTLIRHATFLRCISRGRVGPVTGGLRVQLLVEDGYVKRIYRSVSIDPV